MVNGFEKLPLVYEFVLANRDTNKPKRKWKDKTEKLNCSACLSLAQLSASSKEESSHPPADALSVVQDVELVDELVHTVARLGDGS